MLTFKNEDARGIVAKNLGDAAGKEVAQLDFLPFPELSSAVKADIAYLKGLSSIPKDVNISGYICKALR